MKKLIQKTKKQIPFWLGKKLRSGYQKSLSIWYKGHTYQCPYCKNEFRKLLSAGEKSEVIKKYQVIGSGYRENCSCPRCYSKDRDRLIYLYLEKETNIFKEKNRVLHIAPEACLKELFISLPNIHYTDGVKGVRDMGYYYDRRTREVDIIELEMEDQIYDLIICNHVLEHVYDDVKAMKEFYRVLKPGGWAILQVPISPILEKSYEDESITSEKERSIHFGQYDHIRIYGQDYFKRLESAGFQVEQFDYRKAWGETVSKYALNKKENLFIVHKPK